MVMAKSMVLSTVIVTKVLKHLYWGESPGFTYQASELEKMVL